MTCKSSVLRNYEFTGVDNGIDSNQISAADDGLDPFQMELDSIPKTGSAQWV